MEAICNNEKNMQQLILSHLEEEVEQQYGVKVLLAVESRSWAWGFHSDFQFNTPPYPVSPPKRGKS